MSLASSFKLRRSKINPQLENSEKPVMTVEEIQTTIDQMLAVQRELQNSQLQIKEKQSDSKNLERMTAMIASNARAVEAVANELTHLRQRQDSQILKTQEQLLQTQEHLQKTQEQLQQLIEVLRDFAHATSSRFVALEHDCNPVKKEPVEKLSEITKIAS